jgi:hypothetical protein
MAGYLLTVRIGAFLSNQSQDDVMLTRTRRCRGKFDRSEKKRELRTYTFWENVAQDANVGENP